jgi:hypothetical protein
MRTYSKYLVSLISSIGVLTINLIFILPAKANVACEAGTISYYPNNSLAKCVLTQDTTVQISMIQSGVSNFPCKAKNYIFFDDRGQFEGCQLADDIKITRNSSLETCAKDYMIAVSPLENGKQSIICRQ